MKIIKFVQVCTLLAISLLLTGCFYEIANLVQQASPVAEEYYDNSINLTPAVGGAAYFGTSLNMPMRNPLTLNPLINQDRSVDRVLGLVFEPLVEVRENMRPAPVLASRIVFAGDGMSALVTLRADALWSDGISITSSDVAFSVNVINSELGSYIYKEVIRDIVGVDIIDRDNFRVRFSRPQGGMGFALAFPIIPRHYFEGHINLTSARNMAPIGSGVYRVESVEAVSRVNLVVNENNMLRTIPYITRAYAIITDSTETDFMAFEQGIVNVLATDIMGFGRFSGIRNVTITNYDTNNFVFLGFNLRNPLIADLEVREIIAHAINREHILNNIYLGIGRGSSGVINPVSHFYRPNLAYPEFDMEKARNLLFQIGARDHDNEGVFSKEINGHLRRMEFRLLVNIESPERVAIAHTIKENLEMLGMKVHLDIYDFETYLQRLNAGNFDMFLGMYGFSAMPDFMPLFHSNSINSEAHNHFSFSSEAVDELLEQIERAPNEETLWQLFSELQEVISRELPIVGIKFSQNTLLSDMRISGDKRPVMGNVFNGVERWQLN